MQTLADVQFTEDQSLWLLVLWEFFSSNYNLELSS